MRLPDFLIIGTAKAGTSAATLNLSAHPDVAVCPRYGRAAAKEVHFFRDDRLWDRGLEWYASRFAWKRNRCMLGEKSTDYLADPVAVQRIRDTLPDCRLIVFLREPVARAYSHWNHFCRKYGDSSPVWHCGPFAEVVDSAESGEPWYFRELIDFGLYDVHLENLWHIFPPEQVHVTIAERVLADMATEYDRIFEFLGVDQLGPQAYQFDNSHPYPSPIDQADRDRLENFYRPHVERLQEMLGDDLKEWEPVS